VGEVYCLNVLLEYLEVAMSKENFNGLFNQKNDPDD